MSRGIWRAQQRRLQIGTALGTAGLVSGLLLGLAALPAMAAQKSITFGYWDTQENAEQWFIKPFEAEHPDIKVNYIYLNSDAISGANRNEKVLFLIASGQAPDVIAWDDAHWMQVAGAQNLLDVTKFMQRDGVKEAEWYPEVMQAGHAYSAAGQLQGLPYNFIPSILMYNKSLFDAAGVAYPEEGQTWDQLATMSDKLTKGEGNDKVWGLFADNAFEPINIGRIRGLSQYSADGHKVTIQGDAWADAFQYWADVHKHKGVTTQKESDAGISLYAPWGNGRIAMLPVGSWWVESQRRADLKFDWDITMYPSVPENPEVGPQPGGTWLTIASQTKQPEAAWQFVKFLSGDAHQLWLAQNTGGLSARVGARYLIGARDYLPSKPPAHYTLIGDGKRLPRAAQPVPEAVTAKYNGIVGEETKRMLRGEQSAGVTVANIHTRLSQVMADALSGK